MEDLDQRPVTDLSSDKILRDEADCRTGKQDISSPSCVDAIARVRRNPVDAVLRPGEVKEIVVNPINAAVQAPMASTSVPATA